MTDLQMLVVVALIVKSPTPRETVRGLMIQFPDQQEKAKEMWESLTDEPWELPPATAEDLEFEQTSGAKLAAKVHPLLLGSSNVDVLGVCLAAVLTAAKSLKLSKLDLQKELVRLWDGVQ